MDTIVLASGSPRRRDLLLKYKLRPIIEEPQIEEKIYLDEAPEQVAMALSFEKVAQVANKFNNGEIIIGADTIVACDGLILGKPKNEYEGKEMIKFLSNREHQVITGISIMRSNCNIKIIDYESTIVKFRKLSDKKIQKYIESNEYIDKAGGYGIQGLGSILVEYINGCYFNVVGLPIYKLDTLLERYFNINLL
ncbi:Maf family protein [Schnuerera sp. xch1]|uniref:Maf family protein n=1 Tax=Schnuerera sp. xch1 TaxID=2874283 RepID=UPI001CBCEA68|nr:Maf family protein [Schnuerera sp. xch1]MBZ2175338.1 Maf family protein [Schnuerera sp. xch1]